jgi:hypothetical protein
MIRRFSVGPIALLLALSSCIDNDNVLGSLQGSGGETPIHLGGANNNGGTGGAVSGGSGNAPGKGAEGGSSSSGGLNGATATATCRANSQQITLAKACIAAGDCVLIQNSASVSFPSADAGACNTLVIGINRSDEARFAAFSDRTNCPPPVGCGVGPPMQQTEDGKVVPLSATVSVDCIENTCRSYAP